MPRPIKIRMVFSGLAVLAGFGFTYNLIRNYGFGHPAARPFEVKVADIGTQMLSTTEHGFVLPFEVVSILLLAAMIGCIVIAMKSKTAGNTIDQLVVKHEIKMEEPV